jgi:Na+/H+ antiporter NhaD/arsenite permease-like protein
VNLAPVILVTGPLASLLWLATLHRLGVPARARDFARIGACAGLPGAAAGAGVALALFALGLH